MWPFLANVMFEWRVIFVVTQRGSMFDTFLTAQKGFKQQRTLQRFSCWQVRSWWCNRAVCVTYTLCVSSFTPLPLLLAHWLGQTVKLSGTVSWTWWPVYTGKEKHTIFTFIMCILTILLEKTETVKTRILSPAGCGGAVCHREWEAWSSGSLVIALFWEHCWLVLWKCLVSRHWTCAWTIFPLNSRDMGRIIQLSHSGKIFLENKEVSCCVKVGSLEASKHSCMRCWVFRSGFKLSSVFELYDIFHSADMWKYLSCFRYHHWKHGRTQSHVFSCIFSWASCLLLTSDFSVSQSERG